MAARQPDPRTQQVIALLAAYQVQTQAIRAALDQYVQRLWRSLGQWRDRQLPVFVRQVVPTVAGAQSRMAALTAAYLAAQQRIALGGPGIPAAVDVAKVSGAAARNGTDPTEVYARPFHLVWRQLDELPREPGSIDKAIQAGLNRALELALDDTQLAKQKTALQILSHDDKVVGYRRVLEGSYSCALCIVASTQRYHKDQLLPIHGGCDCSVLPIYGTADPGRTIESMVNVDGKLVHAGDLPDIHDRIEQRFGRSSSSAREIPGATDARGRLLQYRDVLVTHEHGELGPVLAVRGAKFTGPGDLAA